MKKYPLIEKLGSYILDKESAIGVVDVIHAEDLEVLLENAIVVYGRTDSMMFSAQDEEVGDTHKALLIGIEPIEQKKVTITKEDLENALYASGNLTDVSFKNLCEELGL